MEDILATWITKNTEEKGWSLRELGRRAEISHATISNIVSGKSKPTFEFCFGIAKAFGEQPEKIFRMAGLLPPKLEPSPGEDDLLTIFRQLPSPQQRFLLASARGLQGRPASEPVTIQKQQEESHGLPAVPAVPDDKHIMELFERLDVMRRRQVYDFARWMLKEQEYPLNPSGELSEAKKKEWQTAIEHIDLLLAVDKADPLVIERVIGRLQEILYAQKEKVSR